MCILGETTPANENPVGGRSNRILPDYSESGRARTRRRFALPKLAEIEWMDYDNDIKKKTPTTVTKHELSQIANPHTLPSP